MASETIPVLINRSGGAAARRGDALADEVTQAFAAAGLAIDLQLVEGCDMVAAVAAVADRPLVAVGGGDGTIGCAAGSLIERGSKATLAVLPLGTLNHLARELGMAGDLPAVAEAIAAGATRRIDVGTVNGHFFINNASLGVYPQMVRLREAGQERGLPKWLAKLPASWGVLKRLRHHRLRLRLPGSDCAIRTPLLFVGNNRYALDLGHLGERASLEDGVLSLYALGHSSRTRLIGFALKALIGRADRAQAFAAIGDAAAFEVEVHAGAIDVALDGEVMRLKSPLRFAVAPAALSVIVPAAPAA